MPKAPNPVAYAEDTLGVHEILEGVIAAREKLDKEILTTWANARDAKRKAESDLEDREMELVISERGKHPDISETAFRGHPLAAPPRGAAAIFYGIWPALVVAGAFIYYRRH